MKKSVEVQVSVEDMIPLFAKIQKKYLKKNSSAKNKTLTLLFFLLILIILMISISYSSFDLYINLNNEAIKYDDKDPKSECRLSFHDILKADFTFDMRGHDVMVFLHIQKTGGTMFGKHLVLDLNLERPCACNRKKQKKKCKCLRPDKNENWLFSRYSTGWKCGLHADWTELINCVDPTLNKEESKTIKRRYFYITILRNPVSRFLSEFLHVNRGATWKASRHWCDFKEATPEELPSCYTGDSWEGVSLDEFLECPYNLANNRQVRMLADLTKVGCYNKSAMPEHLANKILLSSAKNNLNQMAFFGLTELQYISQYVFEETFNLHFLKAFQQLNDTLAASLEKTLTEKQLSKIRKCNTLDLELYKYAYSLLWQRYRLLKKNNSHIKNHLNNHDLYSDFLNK